MENRLLEIYLADHLAGAMLGVELSKRAARNNRGTETGVFLDRLVAEIEADRRTLADVVGRLGMHRSKAKEGVSWLTEKVSRLKLNGRVRGYSPLSRLVELEGLSIGIAGKQALWDALREATGVAERLGDVDLLELAERARRQRVEVEAHRLRAARAAFEWRP